VIQFTDEKLKLQAGTQWNAGLPGGYSTIPSILRPQTPGHIFLIFKYCRMSGADLTASSPRAEAAAAIVIAVMYPSVRIACLCSSADRRQRSRAGISGTRRWESAGTERAGNRRPG
jgi:hypothetical protein